MKFRKSLMLFLLSALTPAAAFADAEFYGIQMRDEHVAKSLVLLEDQLSAEEIQQGALFDKSVYATASLKEDADQRVNFSVNIFNNSNRAISTDYEYRDYYLVTKEGRKYPLYDPETQFGIDEILPKTNVTFQPSLGNLVISKKNIKMIVCSFDLGRTTLVLFPSSKKEAIERLTIPPIPASVPMDHKEHKRGLPRLFARRTKSMAQVDDRSQAILNNDLSEAGSPMLVQQGDRTLLNGETRQAFDWPQDNPTPTTRSAVQPLHADSRVAEAIKNFVYVPAMGVESAVNAVLPQDVAATDATSERSSKNYAKTEALRSNAQVLQYNPAYKFITINAGVKDGLKKNMLIYILRDGKTIAQARIKQIREAVSAASVIPDSVISEVRSGDKISLA